MRVIALDPGMENIRVEFRQAFKGSDVSPEECRNAPTDDTAVNTIVIFVVVLQSPFSLLTLLELMLLLIGRQARQGSQHDGQEGIL